MQWAGGRGMDEWRLCRRDWPNRVGGCWAIDLCEPGDDAMMSICRKFTIRAFNFAAASSRPPYHFVHHSLVNESGVDE